MAIDPNKIGAKQAPGTKREKLLGGYTTKAVGACVAGVRSNGSDGTAVTSHVELIYF